VMTGYVKSLGFPSKGDPVSMQRVNGWLRIFWIAMIQISIATDGSTASRMWLHSRRGASCQVIGQAARVDASRRKTACSSMMRSGVPRARCYAELRTLASTHI
jgi:hypothetical protein